MYDARVKQSFESVRGLTVTASGDILAVGSYRSWPASERLPHDTAAVARYLPNGHLDKSFGGDGTVYTAFDARGEEEAVDVSAAANGDVTWAGYLDMPTSGRFVVGGYHADGSADVRFGSSGHIVFAVSGGRDSGESLSVDNAGRLVIAGIAGSLFGVARFRLTG